MSSAQTADRILAGKWVPTGLSAAGVENLRALLRQPDVAIIVADNVADYVRAQHGRGREYRIGDWPCLAPPWNFAWIEYPSTSRKQRRGAWCVGFDLLKATPDERSQVNGMIGEAIADAENQSPGEVVRWALVMCLFVDDLRHVQGPMGAVIWVLDEHGKELGNRWFLRPESEWQPTTHDEAMWLHAAALPALQTIAFAHCRNVVVDRHKRPAKLASAYRRRHGEEPLGWRTVRLELPRRASGPTSPDVSISEASSLHIVAGHFAHYGDCCPTTHEPKGKLFGRLTGVYWMPQHLRGDPSREARAEHVVTVGAVA